MISQLAFLQRNGNVQVFPIRETKAYELYEIQNQRGKLKCYKQIASQKSEQILISTTTGDKHCWKSFPNIALGFALSMETLL